MIKKFSTLLLTATIVISMVPAVFASTSTQEEVLYPLALPYGQVESAPIGVPYEGTVDSDIYEITSIKFTDIENHGSQDSIQYLLGRGIVMGYENAEFRPDAKLSQAEAMTLLTKAFELKANENSQLNINSLATVTENKWYSEAFLAAVHNEVKLDEAVLAEEGVTREQFAGWIIDQLDRIGSYPVNRMYIHIADGEQIAEEYASKVQVLLLTQLATLSEDHTFRPQDNITRAEASEWLAEAVKFADHLREKGKSSLTEHLPFEFNAESALTQAETITLLKKALQLSDDKAITANDAATTTVTREQLATWIIDEFNKIGPFPVIMMYIHIADEENITPEMSNSIQTLLLTSIAQLDDEGKFRPKDAVTGAEAVAWLEKAAEFATNLKANLAETE